MIQKKYNYLLTVAVLLVFLLGETFTVNAQQLAFPGAEGYGRFASGGRGNGTNGRVVEVTNLKDDLTNPPVGSFRWAFKQAIDTLHDPILNVDYYLKQPLTVVFRVGGVIQLKGELRVQRNNVTIAGQTAPGEGICFGGGTLNFSASHNVIVRYIRSRPGDELGEETSAFRIENGGNFIIDHCSFSWGIEETTHFSSDTTFTVQWNIVSESLYNSIHKKGPRGYAAQWGGQYATYHHNLLADHNSRMPRINGSNENDVYALVDYRNNVNFNWGSSGAFYGGEWEATDGKGFCHTNVVNNYFIPGPATDFTLYFARPSYNREGRQVDGYGQWYFNGNVMVGDDAKTADNWLGVSIRSEIGTADNIRSDQEFVRSDGALEAYDEYTQSAEGAYKSVMKNVGAILPERDTIDSRVIAEVEGKIPIVRYAYLDTSGQETPVKGLDSGIIDTQRNLVPNDAPAGTTAWDVYTSSTDAPADTDHDGIPDSWEEAHGLDKNDVTDGRKIAENGYSNLENYLNSMDVTVTSVPKLTVPGNDFKVYPNPVNDELHVRSNKNIVRVEVYDLFGKQIKSVANASGVKTIGTSDLANGIYLIKAFSSKQNAFYQKIVKQ